MHAKDLRLSIYRLDTELGRGGMGSVYRAVSEADGPAGPAGTMVAVKVFHAHLAGNERHYERFRREAEIGRTILHPHVVRTFDFGQEEVNGETAHFMAMELVEGQTLSGLVDELGTIPRNLCRQIADQILSALEAIHERGIVHRDLKPENVVITPDHRVLLMDLGVARILDAGHTLTESGEFVGSLAYAAPEQFSDADSGVDARTDVYALGLVLHFLLTGDRPFADDSALTIFQQKLAGAFAPPRLPGADVDAFWNEVVVTATRMRPAERFASAAEMRKVLREGEAGEWWRTRADRAGTSIAERALRRLGLPREAPFVGREPALASLRQAWEEARESGGTLLLGGRSGVGKSRLLFEFLGDLVVEGGAFVAAGRCSGTGGRSYQPFAEAIGDILLPLDETPEVRRQALEESLGELLADTPGVVPHLAELLIGGADPALEGALSRDGLLAALARLVQRLSKQRPVVLAVEDLHLAGSETLDLFRYVSRCAHDHAVLLVGIYNEDEVEVDVPLHDLVAAPAQSRMKSLFVRPLEEGATEAIVRAVVGVERTARTLARPLHTRADGNAYLILEMLAQLKADGALVERDGKGLDLVSPVAALQTPSTVRDAVNLKLARLDDEQRETLEAAAVLGYEFEAPLLAAVLEQKRIHLLKRLAILERKHRVVVTSGKGAFRFASHHIFQAVYDGIGSDLREEYHGLIADTILEGLDDPEAPDAKTAHSLLAHLFRADRATEAEPFLEAALQHVAANFHASYAIPFLEGVAEAFAGASAEKRIAIALKQWTFYDLVASRADQMRVLEVARDLAEEIGDKGQRARVHALRAGSYWYAGDYEKAVSEAETGLDLAQAAGDRKWEATCNHTIGAIAFRRGDLLPAAERMREALRIRRAIGDRRGEASSLQALALVMPGIGEAAEVLPTMEEALRIWREVGERRGEAAVQMNIGMRLVDAARYDEGLVYLEEAIEKHRETGALLSEAMGSANLGRAHELLGRCDEARAAWDRALALFVDLGDPNGETAVRIMLGSALVSRGEYRDAKSQFETAIELAAQRGAKAKLVSAHCELGRLFSEIGEHEDARHHLELALSTARETGSRTCCMGTLSALGSAALAEGDPDRAVQYLEEALPDAREADSGQAALVLTRYARALQAVERPEDAKRIALEAQERIAVEGDVSPAQGAEIFRALASILGTDECRAEFLEKARALDEALRDEAHTRGTAQYFPTRDGSD